MGLNHLSQTLTGKPIMVTLAEEVAEVILPLEAIQELTVVHILQVVQQ